MKIDQVRRLKALKRKNGRLKKVVADLTLDKAIPLDQFLKQLAEPKTETGKA